MDEEVLKKAVSEAVKESLGSLFVEREQHFLDHQFIAEVRTFGDRIKGQACKTVTNSGIIAIITLLLWGLYYFVSKVSSGAKP